MNATAWRLTGGSSQQKQVRKPPQAVMSMPPSGKNCKMWVAELKL